MRDLPIIVRAAIYVLAVVVLLVAAVGFLVVLKSVVGLTSGAAAILTVIVLVAVAIGLLRGQR
jgi:hypothetical protein